MPIPAVLLEPGDAVVADVAAPHETASARLTRAIGWASLEGGPTLPDPLADLLIDRVLNHEGPFAVAAERHGPEGIDRALMASASADLRLLQHLVATTAWPPNQTKDDGGPRAVLKRSIVERPDWGQAAPDLATHFHRYGAGLLGRHRVFRWGDDGLTPVAFPDPVSLDDLIGYEAERAPLLDNLGAFSAGRPANNALLHGDRGAGKSSTVKALAAAFPMERLRLVEVGRHQLVMFPAITSALRQRTARFLVFVDDLSFEEGEVDYAALKTLLEGGVEAQPDNVLLYATSNRRHLVRETLADRRADHGTEVHVSESFQEKLSLSDRFGLRMLFLSPDQDTYLRICREIAMRRGIDPDSSFNAAALMWCRRHNARSCRTARQFVDSLHR